jgi:5-(carboxyamino)imidazole ribonucleotide synthase
VTRAVLPGARIGVLGSGQLGRMFAIAARRMGYRVHTYSPDTDTPTGQVSDLEVVAPYSDLDRVREFARGVEVVTFEFENVPAETAAAAAEYAPVRPAGSVLHTTQQRRREKEFLARHGFPLPPHAFVRDRAQLDAAIARIGAPAVLKSAEFGYDGKGQQRIDSPADAATAWRALGERECVLEAWVEFERECSILAARGPDGSFAHWGLIENRHSRHILDVSSVPADVPQPLERNAVELARALLETLGVVGVLCIELFVTRGGELLVNELAPRPHNSGHLTIDASLTSQFEQQLRAVCGLPLGATDWLSPAAMANLLGDLWQRGEPDWAAACAQSRVKLHLYGKAQPKPGRKMGHLTVLAPSAKQAVEEVLAARSRLAG